MNRRNFLSITASTAALTAVAGNLKAAKTRPNIVFIISDDQGWGDLSIHGNTNVKTPSIDSIGKDGAILDRFYVCPVCAPTRASLMTGRYDLRTGVVGVTKGAERMNLDEVTIADIFKAGGYATGAFGKWHNGSQYPFHPNGRGFQEFYGFCCGHWSNYFKTILEHNGKIVRSKGFIIDDLTDKAIEFIDKNKKKPFFCWVPYNTPHSPFQVPDKFYDRVKKRNLTMYNRDKDQETPDKTIAALAMCENIDWNVGRILKKISSLGLKENTIVIYISDNGPNSWRWNDDMKGKKGSIDEGGTRVPFLIRWPGRIKPGRKIKQISGAIDMLPTLVDMTGIKMLKTKPLDGISLKPLFEGKAKAWPDRMIFTIRNRRGGTTKKGKKWTKNKMSVRTQQFRADDKNLFDMIKDPGQRNNIAGDKPDLHKKLVDALNKMQKEVMKGVIKDRPYPVGYREFPMTVLPAQDCVWEGKTLKFSAKAPNSSWLTNWTDSKTFPYWNIEVATTGTYRVTVMYTCPKKDIGSEIELAFKNSKIKGKVTKPYDPKLLPSPDRVDRGSESYEKEFKPLELGKIKLSKGRGRLTLKALSMPGSMVMDMREVRLKLL